MPISSDLEAVLAGRIATTLLTDINPSSNLLDLQNQFLVTYDNTINRENVFALYILRMDFLCGLQHRELSQEDYDFIYISRHGHTTPRHATNTLDALHDLIIEHSSAMAYFDYCDALYRL